MKTAGMNKTQLLEIAKKLEARCDKLGITLHGRADMDTRKDLLETHIDDLEEKIVAEEERSEMSAKDGIVMQIVLTTPMRHVFTFNHRDNKFDDTQRMACTDERHNFPAQDAEVYFNEATRVLQADHDFDGATLDFVLA